MSFAKKPRGCKQTKIAIHRKATAVNFISVSVFYGYRANGGGNTTISIRNALHSY
jgi:hypothetical protein